MKSIGIKIFIIVIFVIGIINIPSFSRAETQIDVQEGEIGVNTSPNNPQPYKNVTINLISYATDLNMATITWQTDSGIVLYGIGKTSYTFQTGGPNTTTTFDITIAPPGSMSTIKKQVIINPSEIELMWESADGYTPPFYRGKSLPISGALIKVVAIPNTNTIKSGNGDVSYSWKNNDDAVLDASGYNKNSFVFKNSMFDKTNKITVNASSVNGDYSAENTVEIPLFNPEMIFYKKSPIEGVLYNNGFKKEVSFKEDEITIVGEPYFLSVKGKENNLLYTWKINDEIVQTPTKKTELTIRPDSHGGYATINFIMENTRELFQNVEGLLKINL